MTPVRKLYSDLGVFISVFALAVCSLAHARPVRTYTFDELFDKSDLAVIATPTTKTADTGEMTFFTGVATLHPDGHSTEIPAAGVQTAFKVIRVLKGSQDLKQFTLHHYRNAEPPDPSLPPNAVAVGPGPLTVWFDPSDKSARYDRGAFLMFLVAEADGRYSPYGDNTDPAGRSIIPLGFMDMP